MTKVVYNNCYGGFSLSKEGMKRYLELTGKADLRSSAGRDIERDDPALVRVVEELGVAANGSFANLTIQELEPGTKYRVQEYDGNEWVETEADIEWKIA
jgi:hypothetical protein